MIYVSGGGVTGWFAESGGTFTSPAGPLKTYSLVENQDDTFTLSDKYGNESHYSSAGLLTSRVDRNGNTTEFDYIDADSDSQTDDLDTVTDQFGRVVANFAYTNGLVSSVTDQAGRVTTFTHSSGRLTAITRPDPDAGGSQTSPVTELGYEGTSFRLTTVTDALDRVTTIEYDFAGRIESATFADDETQGFTVAQTRGLADLSVEGTAQDPAPVYYPEPYYQAGTTDPMQRTVEYDFDRFGFVTRYKDALGHETLWQRDADGLVTLLTEPDPDGSGSQYTAPVTEFEWDSNHNLTGITFPDDTTQSWVYDTDLNQPESFTDELDRTTDYTYSTSGNLLTVTGPAPTVGGTRPVTTYTYTSEGFVETITLPDADATGPRAAPVIEYEYDTYGRLETIINADETTRTFGWSTADRLTSETDELSRTTSYAWDALDRLLSVTAPDPDGAGGQSAPVTSFTYDAVGNRLTVTDALGNVTSSEFDERNRLVETTLPDPDGAGSQTSPVWQRTYNAAGQLLTIVDPLSNVTTRGYDGAGRLTSVTLADPDGAGGASAPVTTYTLDNLGRTKKITDALGRETKFLFDERGRVVQRTDPDPDAAGSQSSPVWTFVFDDAGQLTSVSDPLARVTSHEYDLLGRLVETKLADPDGQGGEPRPELETEYDLLGNVLIQRDAIGNETVFEYDIMSRVTTVTQEDPDGAGPLTSPVTTYAWTATGMLAHVTDALGRRVTTTYDNLDRPIKRTMAYPSTGDPGTVPVWTWEYDPLSRVITESDPNGNSVQHEYDHLSREIETTLEDPDGAGAQSSPVISRTFDALGNLLTETDPLGQTVQFEYDNLYRRTQTTLPDPDGAGGATSPVYSRTFDAVGNVLTETDPTGAVTEHTYDGLNRRVETVLEDPDGAGGLTSPTYSWSFDAASQVVTATDAMGREIDYVWDGLGRLIEIQGVDPDGAGGAGTPVWETEYDLAGNVLIERDPLGHERQHTYDNLSRRTLTTLEDPDGAGGLESPTIAYTWDAVGNLLSLVDPVSNTTSWTYDDQNRPIEETNELADSRLYEYDHVGNVVEITDRNGRVREFEHDNLYRLVEERWLDGQTVVHTITSTWDAASQLTSISDAFATYTYSRDNLGRVTSVDNDGTANGPNVVLSYGYEAAGRRTSLSAEIDSTLDFVNTYTRDALGRITRIEQDGQSGGNSVAEKRVDLTYLADGSFDEISRYEDLAGTDLVATSTWGYDDAGRLTSLEHAKGANTLADYSWAYDAASRITQFVSDDGTTDYTYDDTHQLTEADHSYQSDESYEFDENGNRTSAGSATYAVGTNNQLESDGTHDYLYDDEGNRTRKTTIATGAYVEYSWDHRNRLVAVTFKTAAGATTARVEFTYDPFNRLIRQRTDSDGNGTFDSGRWFAHDGGDIVLVFDDAGSLELRLVHGPATDQVLAAEDAAGDVRWYLADNLGTVRDVAAYDDVLDATSVVNHLTYDSFGRITSQSNASEAPFQSFTGRIFVAEAGLYWFRARWYDAAVGRFVSEDPAGFAAGDTNLARYVGNSPTNLIDPTGLTAEIPEPNPEDFRTEEAFAAAMQLWYSHQYFHASRTMQARGNPAGLDSNERFTPDAALRERLRQAAFWERVAESASMDPGDWVDWFEPVLDEEYDEMIASLQEQRREWAGELLEALEEMGETVAREVAMEAAGNLAGGVGDEIAAAMFASVRRWRRGQEAADEAIEAINNQMRACFVAGTQVVVAPLELEHGTMVATTGPAAESLDSREVLLAAAMVPIAMFPLRRRRKQRQRSARRYRVIDDAFADSGFVGRTLDVPTSRLNQGSSAAISVPVERDTGNQMGSMVDDEQQCRSLRVGTSIGRSSTPWHTPRVRAARLLWTAACLSLGLLLLVRGLVPVPQTEGLDSATSDSRSVVSVERPPAYATKNIEDIEAGDLVLAAEPETGSVSPMRVVRTFRRISDHLRILTCEDAVGDKQTISTTDEHPFWLANCNAWVRASELRQGDVVRGPSGETQTVVSTESKTHPEGHEVFNIEVAGLHTYFVTGEPDDEPILVHNQCAHTPGRGHRRRSEAAHRERFQRKMAQRQREAMQRYEEALRVWEEMSDFERRLRPELDPRRFLP